jgi:hypothetical protein
MTLWNEWKVNGSFDKEETGEHLLYVWFQAAICLGTFLLLKNSRLFHSLSP